MNSSSFKLSSIEVQMFKKRIYFLLSVLGLSLQLRAWPLGEARARFVFFFPFKNQVVKIFYLWRC